MTVVYNISELQEKLTNGSCLTIGNFDGVHIGHQALLHTTRNLGQKKGLASIAMTFEPHPLRILAGKTPPFITLIEQKLDLLANQGLDYILCQEFTPELAGLSPEEFVKHFLVSKLKVKELVIGHDYVFGKGRAGNFSLLQVLGKKWDFQVHQVPAVIHSGAVVSSTRIRALIQQGNVVTARPLLGRYYQVKGQVIEGQKRGGPLLGIPTANLHLVDELFPQTGVYAVWAEYEGTIYPAVANLGYNPTFGNKTLSVEVHILNFSKNIYGQDLRVHFVQRLRNEQKFPSIHDLLNQIKRDIQLGKEVLERSERPKTWLSTPDQPETTIKGQEADNE